jgi:predicted MPP superfamily phosphohydrolase
MDNPPIQSKSVRATRRRFVRFVLSSAVAGATLGLAGWRTGRWALRVETHVFRLESLPAGFDGFRILLLSDVHAGADMDGHRMSEVVGFVNSLGADLIVIAGDMVDGGPQPRIRAASLTPFEI